MDYECPKCGYCVGRFLPLWAHYQQQPECALAAEAARIEQAKGEILDDMRRGVVPTDVKTFSALHDYVDANEYGALCLDMPLDAPEFEAFMEMAGRVQEAIHQWLQTR